MVCNICSYGFTSSDVPHNQMFSLECSSESCFYNNFVHLVCLSSKFLRNTLQIAHSTQNVSVGRDGPKTNNWIYKVVIEKNSTSCFLKCKDSVIKSISTILTDTEVFSQHFVLDMSATICPWCQTEKISHSHFSQCTAISEYKEKNSGATKN